MITPILLTILYVCFGDYKASLRIRGNNDADLALTVIHDGIFCLTQHNIAGDGETDALIVQDNENIIILARRDSIVIGSAVFQVDTSLPESTPLVLRPCAVTNMDIDQCDYSVFSRAAQHAIEAVFEQPVEAQR
jgi:hypothetical protein